MATNDPLIPQDLGYSQEYVRGEQEERAEYRRLSGITSARYPKFQQYCVTRDCYQIYEFIVVAKKGCPCLNAKFRGV